MARPFSADERQRIRQQLMHYARPLFARQGLKKTSLEELTAPVGIAKSSFYQFFPSKEDLYLELLMQERAAIEAHLLAVSFHATSNMRDALRRLVHAIVDVLETHDLTRRMLSHPDELELLARAVSPELQAQHNRTRMDAFLPYIVQGQSAGTIINVDPYVLTGVMQAITMLTLHRTEIGADRYPQVLDLLIDLVTAGITCTPPDACQPTAATEQHTKG